MNVGTILILISIGLLAGMLSGLVGIGGGLLVVPALIYFLGLSQFEAQGTSLAMMIPPIGILAVYNYYRTDNIHINYAIVLAFAFVIGGYFGSKFTLRLPENKVKLIFGILMLFVAIKMIWSAWQNMKTQG